MTRAGDYGGSARAIREHYDAPDSFWRLMLGPTMTYSSALYEPGDDLEGAQRRKIAWHLDRAGARQGSLLDIGCGWGMVLEAASERPLLTNIVGLTLSETQLACIRGKSLPKVDARLESWARFEPQGTFESIISVGAFEHFAKPTDSMDAKMGVYRDFFARCRKWLAPTGRMSLQTIAFGSMTRSEASAFMNDVIFPESDLPTLEDVITATKGTFEVVEVRNDRLHYAETYDAWAGNLRVHRPQAVAIVGEERVRTFERYLKLSSVGFRMGKMWLLRLALRPIVTGWRAANAGAPASSS